MFIKHTLEPFTKNKTKLIVCYDSLMTYYEAIVVGYEKSFCAIISLL